MMAASLQTDGSTTTLNPLKLVDGPGDFGHSTITVRITWLYFISRLSPLRDPRQLEYLRIYDREFSHRDGLDLVAGYYLNRCGQYFVHGSGGVEFASWGLLSPWISGCEPICLGTVWEFVSALESHSSIYW